jgi:hypothetical protein
VRIKRQQAMLARLNTPRVIDHSPRPPDPEQLRRRAEAADALWRNLVRR